MLKTAKNNEVSSQKAPPLVFDRVLNTPVQYLLTNIRVYSMDNHIPH